MYTLSKGSQQSWLPWFLRGMLCLLALLIGGRLVELQLVKGQYYRSLADGNRVKRIVLPARRGRILSENGGILFGPQAVAITGYLGEADSQEVGKVAPECIQKGPLRLGAKVGQAGLEKEYNCLLAGVDGEELTEVDTQGRQIRLLGRKGAVAGEDLATNINKQLQEKIADLMTGKKGAVVVSKPDGRLIALYSAPTFDPATIEAYLKSEDQPLFNRAIAGLYHPGSVYKILVSLAGLEDKVITEDYLFEDPGVLQLKTVYGDFAYSNWYFDQYGKTEGQINIVRAIARSCDTFFYHLGELLGVENIIAWSEKLKLNQKTGVDLPGERAGFVPSPVWKEKNIGEKWFLGNTYHLAIGQGDLALTPLGVNRLTTVIASGGSVCETRIVGRGNCQDLHLNGKNLDLIKKGMTEACSPGGTGYPFFDLKNVACKTGTAETSKKDVTHAWFSVFTPVDSPEVVVTVLVEEGGEGSTVAGPIARQIIDYWYLQKEP